MGEGMVVDLMTMHHGDTDFHTGGLSLDPSTRCNTDGTASIPGSQGVVKNGKVTFYTCGASSFTMNPTGGTAGSNDLRIIIGDCAQAQIYYNNLTQIYTGNPAATGCGAPAVWTALRIGTGMRERQTGLGENSVIIIQSGLNWKAPTPRPSPMRSMIN